MNRDPRTPAEYQALIWDYCRECCGLKRTVYEACKSETCHFAIIKNRPRKVVLKFDFAEHRADMLACAEAVAAKHGTFQMFSVREEYYRRTGNGRSLNWGKFAISKEFRARFEKAGEQPSMNERSHNDKVIVWKAKQ